MTRLGKFAKLFGLASALLPALLTFDFLTFQLSGFLYFKADNPLLYSTALLYIFVVCFLIHKACNYAVPAIIKLVGEGASSGKMMIIFSWVNGVLLVLGLSNLQAPYAGSEYYLTRALSAILIVFLSFTTIYNSKRALAAN